MRMTLRQMAAAMQATLPPCEAESRVPVCISTDSRTVEAGALFFCIPGARFDGHDFLAEVAAKGALAAVVERDIPHAPLPLLRVDAVVPALGRLALEHRRQCRGKVVGITGSAGKTTVKELLAHLLAGLGPVAKNHKNLNNHIGLPSSMLAATGEEAFWVMETGVNFVGDMDALAAMLEPDVVVAVNVGAAHLEGLQDVATVAREKCKLIEAMRPEGLAVASADCPELQHAVGQTGRQAVWFGTDPATAAEYQCEFISLTETGGRFGLTFRGERLEVDTAFAAPFLAQSLAAAAAAAHVLGAPAGMIAQRLTTARLPEQRFQVQRAGRWIIIDDSYNANPLSMAAVLQAARLMAGSDGSLALVLGEMRELGDAARDAHVTLGVQVAHLAPAAVFWAGGQGDAVAAGLARAGCAMAVRGLGAPDRFMQELADVFGTEGDDVVVVFKGSRANRLERFVTALRDAAQGAC